MNWKVTNIFDYRDYPLDTKDGPYEKTGYTLRLYQEGWGVYTGAVQHVGGLDVWTMLRWLHEHEAKPRKDIKKKEEI
jgi:hypothetical protein